MDWLNDVPGLAAFCGTTVLAAALNHGYNAGVLRFTRCLGRGDTGRESEVEASWEETLAALDAASDDDERERVRAEHARRWTAEFAGMLQRMEPAERGRVAAEARALAREFAIGGGSAGAGVANHFHGGSPVVVNGAHGRAVVNFGTAG
ncbi:hypothetical protein STRCI_008542 [Streptomyces cinnabarinus]|uniref:SMODS and SLOG-associating 2TM effector domain-containing protein n=1 Tax=Streptomyces cinnabarinus TaxID=67287 RepID=A0ABY7KQN8_9ACTN|nr:hypothetical protein [Streptomyces cinnabarinus]WAZ26878.1 hypothetical protein STRCI_008542 [Streptomyces cinnabarinus]